MTRLQEWLKTAGAAAGIKVTAPYFVDVGSGERIVTEALVVGLGGDRGMLVVTSFDAIRPYTAELLRAGYGCTTLSEPGPNERLDLDAFMDMFRDWGWRG